MHKPQKLSFALRTFPKHSASESPAVTPTFFRISSLMSHRKNGFVFFSSPIIDGTVGSPRDRLSLMMLHRATKSGLLGWKYGSRETVEIIRNAHFYASHSRAAHGVTEISQRQPGNMASNQNDVSCLPPITPATLKLNSPSRSFRARDFCTKLQHQ